MEASAIACEAKALFYRHFPSRTSLLSIVPHSFRREFDERIALPNGRDAPLDFGSAAQCF